MFPQVRLPPALELALRRMNPWWEGQPGPSLPPHRRHIVAQIRRRLEQRLAPIVAVRGARQIGKTVAQLHVLGDLLAEGTPPAHVFRVQFDELPGIETLDNPILRLADWYESAVLGRTLNAAAHAGVRTYLFFDEVQNLRHWAPRLKSLVDSSTTQVLVTGSSALRIELGRDSLAGRITTLEAGVLSLTEIALLRAIDLGRPFLVDNGLEPLSRLDFWRALREDGRTRSDARDESFLHFSERGGYPLAHERAAVHWEMVADQLNENVIRRVIRHDLRLGKRGRRRDAVLLEEIFRASCRLAGQVPSLTALVDEIGQALNEPVGPSRVRQYLRFLGDSLLLRLVEPLEIRLKRKRGSPKVCLVDHGLRASWLQEQVPLAPAELAAKPDLSTLAGFLAESVVGATLCTIAGLDVAHLPGRPDQPEIDFVLTLGTHRIPLEVKYQSRPDPVRDTLGLRRFIERPVNRAPFGILVTRVDDDLDYGPDVVALPLSTLMLLR